MHSLVFLLLSFSPSLLRKGSDPLRSSTSSFLEVHGQEHFLIPSFLAARSPVPLLSEFTCVIFSFVSWLLRPDLVVFSLFLTRHVYFGPAYFYNSWLGIMYGFGFILGNGYGWVLGFGAFCFIKLS